MAEKYLVQPDLGFINEVVGLGGDSLKKCFQCATCSVACPIAPDNKPFPRKEMIAASWGLKDKLVSNADIWLCHECGDCSALCPRGAKPGDVLGAIRSMTIAEYAEPKALGKMVNDPQKLPVLLGVPAIIFAVLACITMFAGETMATITGWIGLDWYHGVHGGDQIIHSKFYSTWFVDLVFVPLAIFVTFTFARGLFRFVNDIHANALADGKTDKEKLDIVGVGKALLNIIPTILKHEKFTECSENKERATAHMMVLYSFIGLFFVTAFAGTALYLLHWPSPYSQINPVKWIANLSGVMLVIGSGMMIKNRLAKTDQSTAYKDWYLLGIVFALGTTGMLAEMTRLGGVAVLAYGFYYLHLICIFNLFAFLPFSKMAHIVYRTVAMAYAEWAER